jgi:hypothetical protein
VRWSGLESVNVLANDWNNIGEHSSVSGSIMR